MGKHRKPEPPPEPQPEPQPEPKVKFCGKHGPYNATYDECPSRDH